jgi:hypothetical protein
MQNLKTTRISIFCMHCWMFFLIYYRIGLWWRFVHQRVQWAILRIVFEQWVAFCGYVGLKGHHVYNWWILDKCHRILSGFYGSVGLKGQNYNIANDSITFKGYLWVLCRRIIEHSRAFNVSTWLKGHNYSSSILFFYT